MINKKNMIALTLCGLMMASGSALAGLPSGDSDNNINTNPENDAGTQGTGGVVHFTGKITDASCNITTDSAGQTDSDGNTATGVAVKLYESDRNTQIKIGDISQSIDLAEGEDSKTLNFYANYNATTDVVSTGEADADANFLMVYN